MFHSSISVVCAFFIGFPIAIFIRRRVKKVAQHRVMLLFILPFMVSEIIRIFALRPILSRNGVLNSLLMDFNFIDTPISAFVFTPTGVVIGEIVSFFTVYDFFNFFSFRGYPKLYI
ncbi:hypothetical protein N9E95_00545 [Alphaproteobacteria bacterium]|nr:hypothetical protein [Alphaproteobacteria bacterium]